MISAVAVAALTIWDMCKAIDKTMTIGPIRLVSKTGGVSARTMLFHPPSERHNY